MCLREYHQQYCVQTTCFPNAVLRQEFFFFCCYFIFDLINYSCLAKQSPQYRKLLGNNISDQKIVKVTKFILTSILCSGLRYQLLIMKIKVYWMKLKAVLQGIWSVQKVSVQRDGEQSSQSPWFHFTLSTHDSGYNVASPFTVLLLCY